MKFIGLWQGNEIEDAVHDLTELGSTGADRIE
jgi:hypothetical protein